MGGGMGGAMGAGMGGGTRDVLNPTQPRTTEEVNASDDHNADDA